VPLSHLDATALVLLPGEEFQELNALECDENGEGCSCPEQPCSAIARITGEVLLGMGCYCDDDFVEREDCKYSDETILSGGRRHLQDIASGSVLSAIPISADVSITGAPPAVVKLSFFQKIIQLILSIIRTLTGGLIG